MTKTNKLRQAMLHVQGRTEETEPPVAATSAPKKRPPAQTRIGKRAISGFVTREAYLQLHHIGLDKDCSIQDLVVEALNDLLRKYDKSAVA